MEEKIEKRYYSISEVADLLDVNQSVLRFWEKEFDNLGTRKSNSGRRQYTKADIAKLRNIHYLLKVKKYTLKGARAELKKGGNALEEQRQLMETLQEIRKFLVELRENL